MDLPQIANTILSWKNRQERSVGSRFVVGIAGPPASGKSSLADRLCAELAESGSSTPAVVPMDGYHLDNAVLTSHGLLAKKGAPETFDADGFIRDLQRLRNPRGAVYVPVFDRGLDLARAAGREIGPEIDTVLVEGNYLLLDRSPWSSGRAVFDLSIMLTVPEPVLLDRLIKRWRDHGHDARAAEERARGNDLVNARVVGRESVQADLIVSSDEG
ncbi:nucleoside triphosphate hydrolase [Fodinicurvata sp. EGI_FJ10296]|uniref:nucleoside triphosphate hydrolase n=1 Tax=Fodinicurvata sp. EGI_FJ10296 TaxID=3231908 RepID=UPI003455A126